MSVFGADIARLRSTANQLDNGAAVLESAAKALGAVVTTGARWTGPDADRFRAEWLTQSSPQIARAVEAIHRASADLRRNANEQENASGAAASSATVSSDAAHLSPGVSERASAHGGDANDSDNARAAAAFVAKWEGHMIDPDRSFGAQCFDVFRQYSNEVVGARPNIATDSMAAADIYNRYDHNGVAEFYDRIPFGQGEPQPGDVIVYGGSRANGGYGHVALVTAVDGDRYSVLEQNYTWADGISGNDPAAVRPHPFSDKADGPILGFLRPK